MNSKKILTRRQALHTMGRGLAGGAAVGLLPSGLAQAQSRPQPRPEDRRFLIVVTGTGGASIIDFAMAIRASESANASGLNVYPDAMVQGIAGTPFRAIDQRLDDLGPLPYTGVANQSDFVRRHAQDLMVVSYSGSSVTHNLGEKRSVTGNDAWGGRTLQEIVAWNYGEGLPLANVNMGVGGFIEPGLDASVPSWARHEPVLDPRLWSLGLHGSKGVRGAPKQALIDLARTVRNEQIDANSVFLKTYRKSPKLSRWLQQRTGALAAIEGRDLVNSLNILPDAPGIPLDAFGIGQAREAAQLRETFPLFFQDPLEGQSALAYLLLTEGVSNVLTIGPSFAPLTDITQIVDSPPLGFDFSHTNHRGAQAVMWSRMLKNVDRLIGLLKRKPFGDQGESYWDRTLIYIATEFGRTRRRPAGSTDFGTGHHLNNGAVIISPMANGNTLLGGVDPDTALTYGFDRTSGAPDRGRNTTEAELFGGILQSMGVDTSPAGLPDMPAMRS